MPLLFPPDFLHQLSSLLPLSFLPLVGPGNLSEKAQNKAAKEKNQTSESSLAKEMEEEGKERQFSEQIS